jgi:hypothetical protein
LKRISIGGLAETQDGKFGDILLADALTSYSKVLADLVVTFCMFFTPGASSTHKPDRRCGSDWVIPLIIATPSIIRFRQCLIEYVRVRRAGLKMENKSGQHLANALKYATALPVIYLAAKLRNYNPLEMYGYSEMSLSRLLYVVCSEWVGLKGNESLANDLRYLCTLINSTYSFYWDVTKDWDLTLLTSARRNAYYPYGLRRHRYFSDRQYYLAILVDLVLRFSWLSRFIPGLVWLCETEVGIWLLMFLEVARRWMWIFFRVETECGKWPSIPLS